ncbi:MAG: YbhN family protein [Acidimicrobiia bacterium]
MLDWVPRWLRWAFGALILGLVVWFLVVPQFGEAESALDAVTGVHLGFVLAGGALVALAVYAQAELTRLVLPEPERPGRLDMVQVELASTAVSHTVPGGTAAGTALAYRLLTQNGANGASAGFALGIRGIGSALVLNVILWAALVVSIPTQGFDSRYTTAAVLGTVLLTVAGALAIGLLRTPAATTNVVCRIVRPIPFVDEDKAPSVVGKLSEQLRTLVSDRRLAVVAIGWSAAYWLALAAALWVLLHAFGWTGHPVSVLVAFGIVNVLAAIPITPRGLGVLEAVLIPMLVGFGAPAAIATLGVVVWRLLSFWAPIPLGTLSYVSLRVSHRGAVSREQSNDELADLSRTSRESFGDWAERHALRRRD